MTAQREYTKVGGNDGPVWNPKLEAKDANLFDPKDDANNVLEGYLLEMKENVGKYNSTVYKIHEVLQDGSFGEVFTVWGNTVLDASLSQIELGTFVCIKYEGWKLKKNQSGTITDKNAFQNFSVFTDKNAVPYRQAKAKASGGTTETVEPERSQPKQQAAVSQQRPSSRQPAKQGNASNAKVSGNPFDDDQLPF